MYKFYNGGITMKIGLCYDTKSDYGLDEDNLEYTDFVSLQTVSQIGKAIEQNGYTLEYIGDAKKLLSKLNSGVFDCDLIFNIAEGFGSRNREALIPSILELHHIPYTASDAYGMCINLNKQHTKILVNSIGIPVPKGFSFKTIDKSIIKEVTSLKFPIVLKPNCEGGSMGLYLIHTMEEFINKANYLISNFSFELLVEEYIEGSEITVPIIGSGTSTRALGVVTILNEDSTDIELYDNSLKYIDNVINSTSFKYSEAVKNKLLNYSEIIHNFFNLFDYSRMDYRVKPNGDIYFLEINTMPSLCRDCSFEQCGKIIGLSYYEIVGEIINSARKRHNI